MMKKKGKEALEGFRRLEACRLDQAVSSIFQLYSSYCWFVNSNYKAALDALKPVAPTVAVLYNS